MAATIVDIMMILSVKVFISINYENNINWAAFCTVIRSAQFSNLNPSITPGNHQLKGDGPLFNMRGVQMIIGIYEFLSNVNRSSSRAQGRLKYLISVMSGCLVPIRLSLIGEQCS